MLTRWATIWRKSRGTLFTCGLIISVLAATGSLKNFSDISQQVKTSEEAVSHLEHLKLAMVDAETGQRGYIITNNKNYLRPYDFGVKNTISEIEQLMVLNQSLHLPLAGVFEICNKKMIELQSTINLRDTSFEAARDAVNTHLGMNLMHEFRDRVDVLIVAQQNQIATFETASANMGQWAIISLVASLALMFIFVAVVCHSAKQHYKESDFD